jgi:hypothetical protein
MGQKKKSGTRKTVFAFCVICITAGSTALIVYGFRPAERAPATTASVARNESGIGVMLVPDGNGACNKFSIRNNSGSGTYEGTVPCDSSRPRDSRANLPPALRGMQDSLRNP